MGSIQTPLTSPSSTLLQTSRGYLLQELQVIWDEVGEEEIEREKVLSDIEKECLEVYRKKVESANMGRSRLHQQLAECESQFTHLFLSLGEPSLPHRPEKKAGTLRQQIDSFTPALREMRLRKRERMNQFHGVQVQIQKIKAEIAGLSEYDETATSIIVNENDLSVKKLEEYQAELQKLQNDKNERLQRADKYARKIHELAALLGMNSSMTIRTINPSLNEVYGITKNISDNILGKLDDTVKSLEEEKQKRLEKLRDLGKSMIEMWRLIDTPERERQQFFHVINLLSTPNELVTKPGSLTPTIIQQTEIEVKRLDQLKTTKMKDIFLRKQFELQEICSKWHMEILSPTKIANLTNQVDSGEIDLASLLETMDEEIGKAKEEAYSRMGIIEMVEKWSLADEEERWLEEYNMDDNRYSGSRGAHKNLKRAERARITVTKIPALVHMLISMVGGWEAERNKVFMYDEVPLVAVLEEYITLRREKEEEKQRQRLLKKKTTGEQNNMLLSPRPGTSTQRTPTRSSSVSFNNSSPTNRSTIGSPSHRRFSLSSQKTGSNNFNVHTPSSPFTKEGTRTLRQQFYTPI